MISRADIEHLARLAHEAHLVLTADATTKGPAQVDWEVLAEDSRGQNRDQVRHQLHELRSLGYAIVPVAEAGRARRFSAAKHLDELAVREHARWICLALEKRYSAGDERVEAGPKKTHPDIETWDELDQASREKDRQPWRAAEAPSVDRSGRGRRGRPDAIAVAARYNTSNGSTGRESPVITGAGRLAGLSPGVRRPTGEADRKPGYHLGSEADEWGW